MLSIKNSLLFCTNLFCENLKSIYSHLVFFVPFVAIKNGIIHAVLRDYRLFNIKEVNIFQINGYRIKTKIRLFIVENMYKGLACK